MNYKDFIYIDIETAGKYPDLETLKENHRYLVNGNYKLIYRVSHNEVIINDVFDARQNPAKINDEKRLNS